MVSQIRNQNFYDDRTIANHVFCTAGYGKTWGMMAGKTYMSASHSNIPGMKTVKMRYGPYTVPSNKVTTRTLTGSEEGMLWNYPDTSIAKPCNDCMVTAIIADYEDMQGNSVNINTGQWLHHVSPAEWLANGNILNLARLCSLTAVQVDQILLADTHSLLFHIGSSASHLPHPKEFGPLAMSAHLSILPPGTLPTQDTKSIMETASL
jgi:hypothetical protein